MAKKLFEEVDDLDVNGMILQVEASFGIHFGLHELEHVATFGEFCDIVLAKLPQAEANNCTSQQAFYKLRRAFARHLPAAVLMPATPLKSILPHADAERKHLMHFVETELGFTLRIFGISDAATTAVFSAFVVSFITLFINWHLGVVGLLFSFAGAGVAAEFFDNALRIKTVKDMVEQMVRENYAKSRRNPATVNRSEIIEQIKALFKNQFGFESSDLTRDACF
ncbi:MAG: hypothetical protein ACRYFR_03860 [Janthinobacterium lividum]